MISQILEIVGKFLDIIERPTELTVVLVLACMVFLAWFIPLGVVGGLSWYNTVTLQSTMNSNTQSIISAIQTEKRYVSRTGE